MSQEGQPDKHNMRHVNTVAQKIKTSKVKRSCTANNATTSTCIFLVIVVNITMAVANPLVAQVVRHLCQDLEPNLAH